MKKDRNGRKIYKYKYRPRKKKKNRNILKEIRSFFLMLLFLAALVLLGYSIADPLLKLISGKSAQQSETQLTSESTAETISETAAVTETESETETEFTLQNKIKVKDISAIELTEEDMQSYDALREAVMNINTEYGEYEIKNIVVPLKAAGGYLYYASENETAKAAGAVQSELTLQQIITAIVTEGFEPVAKLSLLEDSIYSSYSPDSCFQTESGSRWIDNSLEAGGKPWLDPFKTDTSGYLESIAAEAASAGFSLIICDDVNFPPFRQSDLDYIGDRVKSETRYTALTELMNGIQKTSEKSGASVSVECDIADYISQKAEAVKPGILKSDSITFNIDLDTLSYSSVTDSSGTVHSYSGMEKNDIMSSVISDADLLSLSSYNIIIKISGDSLTDEDRAELIEEIDMLGYTSYILN